MKRVEIVAFGIEERRVGDSLVFAVRGELDLETAPALRQRLHCAIEGGERDIAIDVSELSFLDSTAISVLVDSQKQLRRLDGGMVLRDPTAGTRRILEVAGLTEFFGL